MQSQSAICNLQLQTCDSTSVSCSLSHFVCLLADFLKKSPVTRHQDENPPRDDLRFPLALAQQIHLPLYFVVLLLLWPEPPGTYYCCSVSPSARRSDVVIPASDRTLSPLAARLSLRTRLGTGNPLSLAASTCLDREPTTNTDSQFQPAQGFNQQTLEKQKTQANSIHPAALLVCLPIHKLHHSATI